MSDNPDVQTHASEAVAKALAAAADAMAGVAHARSASNVEGRTIKDADRSTTATFGTTKHDSDINAEEAWAALEHRSQACDSVHLARLPEVDPAVPTDVDEARWDTLLRLREQTLRTLEGLRQDKQIASNQEAAVTLQCSEEDATLLEGFGLDHFASLCIVSKVQVTRGADDTTVTALRSDDAKCARCWNHWPSVGTLDTHPDLCHRCAALL